MRTGGPNKLDTAEVGDGATYRLHTDCGAGTIIARTKKTITWQRDKATLQNGVNSDAPDKLQFSPGGFVGHTSGCQRYEYERDTEGAVMKFSKRQMRDGPSVWKHCGHRTKSPGCVLTAGRHEHYDFNF